jgi:ATP-dependent DNA helicase 2 subunit 2
MTTKEATVFIVDLGATMGARRHGRTQTDLDWALEYVWDRITTVIATGRKTNLVGVVGLRTDESDNVLAEEEHYQHISVLQPIDQILMPQLRQLRESLKVSATEIGDAISAVVIAVQMIMEKCKKLQYIRRIVLITDARAPMLIDDLSKIRKKISEDKIELLVLGVDFDDAEYGFKEEAKDSIKEENEAILKTLCEDCGGTYGTLAQAIEESEIPRVKTTRPIASFKGLLTLGNPSEYETAMTIDVERYPKIMLAKPPTASSFVLREGLSANEASQLLPTTGDDGASVQTGGDLTAVKNARTYQVEDQDAPGGKRDVALEELAKGYEYGRTAVHISESDRNVTTYETLQGLDILGFIAQSQVSADLHMVELAFADSCSTNTTWTCREQTSSFRKSSTTRLQWHCHPSSTLCTNSSHMPSHDW